MSTTLSKRNVLKYKPWYVKVKWQGKKMDWFYAEKAHETVCICDWVFGWGVVISLWRGHLFLGEMGPHFCQK